MYQTASNKHLYWASGQDFDPSSSTPIHCIWALRRENLSSGFVNNKGADQPAHPHRLISDFDIGLLENIYRQAMSEISIF